MQKSKKIILVTGCAGFIGFHISLKILREDKYTIIGIDNLNNYYDIQLKKDRLKILRENSNFNFFKLDICNQKLLDKNFLKYKYDFVIHMAAQAGVRFSIENRKEYFDTNIVGFYNIIECCTKYKIKHLIYASSSSVYGTLDKYPYYENDNTDRPLSFYAASKKVNETIAHSYSNIFRLPSTGLRFFTVYGPYGRPDMAPHLFTKAIKKRSIIKLFNNGNHFRDFSYIDDVVNNVYEIIEKIPKVKIPFEIYNLGSGKKDNLKYFLRLIEKFLNKKSRIKKLPLQLGDVKGTHSNSKKIRNITNLKPIPLEKGLRTFINWYNKYYN